MIMSCATKSQLKYLSNDDKKKFYLADDEDEEDFDFQYVPVNQFKHIIKDVRRQRIRDEEERVWTSFLKEQEQSSTNYQQSCSETKYKSTRTLAESLEEVDRELMRLEADTLPETHRNQNRIGSYSGRDRQEKNVSARSVNKDSPVPKENGTGSTNFLLTIPEEENNYYYRTGSSESHKPCATYVRKSCSETFKNNRVHSRCYHYNTNNLDYNSSPDISPDRYSDENNSIPVRPDPVAVAKILGIQRKICIVLDSISYELDRIPLPDGENDLHRRQQRVVEFSTRLSRNYLYDLSRQLSNIQRHIKCINLDSHMRLTRRGIIFHMQAIEQKLISAHQLLLIALSAYWKHIPSSVLKSHPGKLKEILQVVIQLKNICFEIKLTSDFYCSGDERDVFLGKETENRCSAILAKFRIASDNESQVPSQTARSTIVTPSRARKQRNRKSLSNRLSMYTMDMRLAKSYQPKKSHSMFQIPRDKKHNCSALKQQQSDVFQTSKKSRSPQLAKGSNEAIVNKTKITIPLKEDDIQTMMETVPSDLDTESPQLIASDRKSEIHENTKESKRLSRNKINNDKQEIKDDNTREKCFSSLLPVIGDLLSLVQNKKYNSKMPPSSSIDTLYNFLQTCNSKLGSNESETHNTKDQIEVGTKNMRLIYYTRKDDEEMTKFVHTEENENFAKFNNVSCQANYLKNNGTLELLVCEPAASCFMDYRNEYQYMLKSNPMYTSNTQNKPWEVVAWIADKLVDELIAELSEDFQMEDIIQKLFDLEFQEF